MTFNPTPEEMKQLIAKTRVRRKKVATVVDNTTTPDKLPTTKQANLFAQVAAEEEAAELQREHDRKVDLLITPKGHQRLRAFGFEVVQVSDSSLPASTSDRRSL